MTDRKCQHLECVCKRRVLIVENDVRWRKVHATNLTKWGYEPVVAEGKGQALLDDAVKKVFAQRCHAALVDMRLLHNQDDQDLSGLRLVQQLKPARSIIVTGFGSISTYRKAQGEHGAFGFFGKEEEPEVLHEAIRDVVNDSCVQLLQVYPHSWLTEHVVPHLKRNDNSPIADDEIWDVLALLFPQAGQIVLEELSGATESPGLHSDAVRHRSIVFKATVPQHQPVFVKLATTNWLEDDKDKIWREVQNYENHVAGKLGGLHFAQLACHKRLWNIGGVAYSFIGNSESAGVFRTFYAAQSDPEMIIKPLRHFFGTVWHGQYQMPTPLNGSLFETYDRVWKHALGNRLESWRQLDKQISFAGLIGKFPEPRTWLCRKKDSSGLANLRQCVIHGDLHADNLLVDSNGHSWAIDFERTGEGHILGDFVELEQDILTRLAIFADQDLTIFYELIITLTKPNKPNDTLQPTPSIVAYAEAYKAFQVVAGLRKIAADQCHTSDMREYYWGLLLDALFVNSKLDQTADRNRWDKTLLLASIICARLDGWDNRGGAEWPPKSWSPIQWTAQNTPAASTRPVHISSVDNIPGKSQFDHGFALLIGVGNTPQVSKLSLQETVNDVNAVRAILIDPGRCAYPPYCVQALTNHTATLDEIRAGFERLAYQVQGNPEATAIIYFSGHGIRSESDGRYGLLPSNIRMNDDNTGFASETVLWSEEFRGLIEGVKARRLLVLIDACHAEGATISHKSDQDISLPKGFTKSPPPDNLLSLLTRGKGRSVISSSGSDQKSYIRRDRTLSIFTHHLVEALQGADNHTGDKDVRVSNLIHYLGERVPASVEREYPGYALKQVPWTEQAAEDFPIALIAGGKGLP